MEKKLFHIFYIFITDRFKQFQGFGERYYISHPKTRSRRGRVYGSKSVIADLIF